MPDTLSSDIKSDVQSRYRQYLSHHSDAAEANDALKQAKASRLWLVGVVVGLFSFQSEFFLGAAFALLGVYFYQIITAQVHKAQAEDAMEELGRWFSGKGLMFQDTTAFFRDDDQLENPLNLEDDGLYQ
ncbi:hypothetical protein [Motiliproteus sediminis]|uniref:hypothetical protein n=1 Tax=Motiliproteus sediminis TaxID=1468178 RepID=UPI001AEF7E99|nr:hypothetical protein [Motiliproteus sediminis]